MGVRKFGRDQCAGLLFMDRIHEGEQVTDRNGPHPGGLELASGAPHRFTIKRKEYVAEIVRAFRDLARQALRRDRRGLLVEVVEQIAVASLALDFLDRPIALGDQQPDLGATHLQQRIGRDGGAVGEEIDVGGIDAAADEIRNTVEHAYRRIVRRARHLLDQQCPGGYIVQYEVRVGPAHIDPDPITRRSHGGALHLSPLAGRGRRAKRGG
jgi:hypothetical protein